MNGQSKFIKTTCLTSSKGATKVDIRASEVILVQDFEFDEAYDGDWQKAGKCEITLKRGVMITSTQSMDVITKALEQCS